MTTLDKTNDLTELVEVNDPEGRDLDACRELFLGILQTAIRDYQYLDGLKDRPKLTKAQLKKVRAITEECHPAEFFASEWFMDVCGYLGADAEAILERVGFDAAEWDAATLYPEDHEELIRKVS